MQKNRTAWRPGANRKKGSYFTVGVDASVRDVEEKATEEAFMTNAAWNFGSDVVCK